MDISKVIYLSEFDKIAIRLKHELHLKKDYELAKFFGISAPSFNARKKNNNFPIKKLKEILEQRSDLSYVDLRWVLTGKKRVIDDDIINKLKDRVFVKFMSP